MRKFILNKVKISLLLELRTFFKTSGHYLFRKTRLGDELFF